LHNEGYYIAVETNGSRRIVYNIDWITVSPKIAEHCIRQTKANEVKYVRCYGQGIPKSIIVCEHYFIIPKYESNVLLDIDLKWCIKLVKENPKWKLGLQLHKHLDIR
jgi:7-carboxy-7-deazaguanine synthase